MYFKQIKIKLPQSHMLWQVIGAAGGMAAAAVLYVGMQQVSRIQLGKALLVEGNPTISENADQVVVNEKKIDKKELERLESRARQVAQQMQEAIAETAENLMQEPTEHVQPEVEAMREPVTEIERNAQDRMAQRVLVQQREQGLAVADQQTNDPVDSQTRRQLKIERYLNEGVKPYETSAVNQQAVARVAQNIQANTLKSSEPSPVTIISPDEALHPGAPLDEPQELPVADRLANSGGGMPLVTAFALLMGLAYHYRESLKRRFAFEGLRKV